MSSRIHALLLAAAMSSSAAAQEGFIPSQRLQVNTDDSIRYATRLPLKEGLAALENVVFSHEHEEAWMYDPGRHEWLEVGQGTQGWHPSSIADLQEGALTVRNSAYIDARLFAQLRPRTDSEIHIHNVLNAPDYKRARFQEEYQTGAAMIRFIKISHAMPSISDLNEALREVVLAGTDDLPFTFYIASFGGVTLFRLTPEGREYTRKVLEGMDLDSFVRGTRLPTPAQEFTSGVRGRLVDTVNALIAERGTEQYEELVQEIFQRVSDGRITLRYASYRDLDSLWRE